MIDYIKRLLKNPTEIYTARNMKNSHYFLFVLLMGALLTIASFFNVKPEIDTISADYDEIRSFIPNFELIDGELDSTEDSYIYETDHIVFYFDPQDKIDTALIDKNMKLQVAPISIGLLDQEIYVNILNTSQRYTYADLNLTTSDLQSIIALDTFYQPVFYAVMLLILYLFNLFLYSMQLLSISIFANLIAALGKTGLRFFQNAKIALLASVIPFLIFAVLNAFQFSIGYQYEIISTASLIIFYLSIKEFKNRLQKQANKKNKD